MSVVWGELARRDNLAVHNLSVSWCPPNDGWNCGSWLELDYRHAPVSPVSHLFMAPGSCSSELKKIRLVIVLTIDHCGLNDSTAPAWEFGQVRLVAM